MSGSRPAAARRSPVVPLATFLVLAYGFSWWPWPLADLAARPDTALMIPVGPSLAAVLVLAWTSGRAGMRDLLRSVVRVRLGRWWGVILLPPLVAAVSAGVAVAAGASAPPLGDAVSVLAASVIAFPVLLVLGGPLGEELGWRGYVLPTLLRHVGPVTATLLLVPMWLVFHLPLIIGRPERYGVPWALMVVGFAFTLTWLQLRTGSVGLAVVFHAVINSSSAAAVQSFATVDRPLVWKVMAGLWLTVGLALAVGPLRASSMTSSSATGPRLPSMLNGPFGRAGHLGPWSRCTPPPREADRGGEPARAVRGPRRGRVRPPAGAGRAEPPRSAGPVRRSRRSEQSVDR